MFTLKVHPNARAWVPREPQMGQIQKFFAKTEATVHILPRSMANIVLGRYADPYAFRGFTRGTDSYLFVDGTETDKSIAWLMAHELCHRMIDMSPTIKNALNEARPHDLDPKGDAFHDIDPAERFCDGIATNILGYRMDRRWWRKRTPKTSGAPNEFGAEISQITPAERVFNATQQILIQQMKLLPGSFDAKRVRDGTQDAYMIRAHASKAENIRRAARHALQTSPRGTVRVTEMRPLIGTIGYGWHVLIQNI